jgi:hypothetical protein
MRRLTLPLLVVSVLILAGCASPQTVTVERTVEVPVTVVIPITVEVPATCPDCPACTACVTCPTPCQTTPTAALVDDAMNAPKGAGSYLVGVDIAAGIWRSSGTDSTCYLKLNTLAGETEDMQGDPPGGTFRIPEGDWVVVLPSVSSCTWTFLKP